VCESLDDVSVWVNNPNFLLVQLAGLKQGSNQQVSQRQGVSEDKETVCPYQGKVGVMPELFAGLTIPDELPPLTDSDQERLITLAGMGTRCRSSVVRDGYSREIELVPGHERSTRLYRQLRHLHAGFTVIGAPKTETWRLLAKVALDGVHPGRRAVIEFLVAHPGEHTTASIAGHCRLTRTPTQRHLEDLVAHGVLNFIRDHHADRWSASEWLVDRWWAVERWWAIPGAELFGGESS
jgi:hypothetical protein